METHQPLRSELVDSFLHTIKQAQSKQQFLTKVHEFDNRFIDDHSAPSVPERQKSVQKLPPMPQQKPKNPFKTNIDDFRHQGMMHATQQSPFSGAPPVRGNYKTQQNFYKQPSSSSLRGDPQYNQPQYNQGQPQYTPQNYPHQHHPMTGNYGYNQNRNGQSQNNQGMGVLNYNAFSQRQYDELKQQFFRPPNMARPPQNDPYNRMSEDVAYNFAMGMGMGMTSSSEILPGETSFSRPTPRNQERVNPFMRQ